MKKLLILILLFTACKSIDITKTITFPDNVCEVQYGDTLVVMKDKYMIRIVKYSEFSGSLDNYYLYIVK